MKTFFHPAQRQHHPRSYLSRGQMREPQEIPSRIDPLLAVTIPASRHLEKWS